MASRSHLPTLPHRATLVLVLAATLAALATWSPAAARGPRGAVAEPDYPAVDARYHSYAELTAELEALAAAYPVILRVSSIGRSAEGRELWVAKVSDHVERDVEPGEPEVLLDALHHAREHLTPEMALSVLRLLVRRYGEDSAMGRRVTRIVDTRVVWIVPMVNPDGLAWDLAAPADQRTHGPDGSDLYAAWRKNRQPLEGTSEGGVDLNRNYGYRWGCCAGSSGDPGSGTYRGPSRWSAPETRAIRDLVLGRVIGGRQRIRAQITFHSYGEQIHYPFGWSPAAVPAQMTDLDHRAFVALADAMAATNGYQPMRTHDLYPVDGSQIDWLYGRQRIFSFTFEMYPRYAGGVHTDASDPPDERIARETRRNRAAVLHLIEMAGCPWAALGAQARSRSCGPFFDDLEVDRGWTVDPDGADTADDGAWARGTAAAGAYQLAAPRRGRASW